MQVPTENQTAPDFHMFISIPILRNYEKENDEVYEKLNVVRVVQDVEWGNL